MASSDRRKGKGRSEEEEDSHAGGSDNTILNHLIDQLITSGHLNKPLDPSAWSESEAIKLEKCLSSMLSRLNSSQSDFSGLMDKYRSLASDYDRLAQSASRSSQSLASSEHEREQAKSKADAAAKELAAEHARHTQAKEEIQKARLALQAVKTAAQYESKRRENEMASIVSRWQKVSASSSSSFQHVATIAINPIEKIGRSNIHIARSADRATLSETALLEDSLNQVHAAKDNLEEENVHLREVVGDILTEVASTLAAIDVEVPSLEDELSDPAIQSITPHLHLSPNDLTAYMSRLFLILRDATQSALQASEEAVATAIEQQESISSNRVKELEESLKAMQEDLDTARLEARQYQEELETLRSTRESRQSKLLDKVKEDQRLLARQRTELEHARSDLNAAQDRLARDKEAFQLERKRRMEEEEERSINSHMAQKRAADDAGVKHTTSKRSKLVDKSLDSASPEDNMQMQPAKTSARTRRTSTTAATLQHILAAGADTPPMRAISLSSKSLNSQQGATFNVSATDAKTTKYTPNPAHVETAEQPLDHSAIAPSSAALAAKSRIQRAVEAARQRSSGHTRG